MQPIQLIWELKIIARAKVEGPSHKQLEAKLKVRGTGKINIPRRKQRRKQRTRSEGGRWNKRGMATPPAAT